MERKVSQVVLLLLLVATGEYPPAAVDSALLQEFTALPPVAAVSRVFSA